MLHKINDQKLQRLRDNESSSWSKTADNDVVGEAW